MNLSDNAKIGVTGFCAAALITVLNYFAGTPVKFAASIIGLAGCLYAGKKLKDQFDVPLIFLRNNGGNRWGGAFGGLIGGISGLYGATRIQQVSPLEFGVELSLLTVYLTLATVLFMGTVLQDIEDGYLEI